MSTISLGEKSLRLIVFGHLMAQQAAEGKVPVILILVVLLSLHLKNVLALVPKT